MVVSVFVEIPYWVRVVALAVLAAGLILRDRWRDRENRTRQWEYGLLFVAGVLGAVYGAIHDWITVGLSPEYFMLGKNLEAGTGLKAAATGLGAKAGFSAGVVGCAIWQLVLRRVPARERCFCIARRVWVPLACAAGLGVTLPLVCRGWDPAGLSSMLTGVVTRTEMSAFLLVWWAHMGSYAGLIVGLGTGIYTSKRRAAQHAGRKRTHLKAGIELLDEKVGKGQEARKGDTVEYNLRAFLNRGDEIPINDPTAPGTAEECRQAPDFVRHDPDGYMINFRATLGRRHACAGVEYSLYGMKEGGYRRVKAGPHLAYRDVGIPGKVPANAVITFDIWLRKIAARASCIALAAVLGLVAQQGDAGELPASISHVELQEGGHAYVVSGIYTTGVLKTAGPWSAWEMYGGLIPNCQTVTVSRASREFRFSTTTPVAELPKVINALAQHGGDIPYWEELAARDVPRSARFDGNAYSVSNVTGEARIQLLRRRDLKWHHTSDTSLRSVPVRYGQGRKGYLRVNKGTAFCMAHNRHAIRLLGQDGTCWWVDHGILYGDCRLGVGDFDSDGVDEIAVDRDDHGKRDVLVLTLRKRAFRLNPGESR